MSHMKRLYTAKLILEDEIKGLVTEFNNENKDTISKIDVNTQGRNNVNINVHLNKLGEHKQ